LSVSDVEGLPDELADVGRVRLQQLLESLSVEQRAELGKHVEEPVLANQLLAVLACSDYVAGVANLQPDWLLGFVANRRFEEPFTAPTLDALIETHLEAASDMDGLMRGLRRVRSAAQVHIIWRDFVVGDYHETVAATTLLADALIDFSLGRLHGWLVEEWGEPVADDGVTAQRMVVFALGKLGADELNLSSDVDLLFAYPDAGVLLDSQRNSERASKKTNQAFFLRLAQRLVQALDNVTADGFAFRVDMRLRPYGDSGALVMNFAALERYYEEQGRGWERYALIRARVCAGDRLAGAQLLDALRPFVYRRYLDFGAVDSLREMKQRVDRERSAAKLRDNIKLGPGGIRDVEFVVQMLQLIWGGRHPELGIGRTLDALGALATLQLIPRQVQRNLRDGYVFLRDTEHKLQGFHDTQTQLLPNSARDQARLAWLMGFARFDAFLDCLNGHRERIAQAFREMIPDSGMPEDTSTWRKLWEATEQNLVPQLTALGMDAPEDQQLVVAAIHRLREAQARGAVAQEGRDRLDALLPMLLEQAFAGTTPSRSLNRVVPLLEAVLRRSAYLVLLGENPDALALLLEICARSRWMASELVRHPALLDDLLDPRGLFELPDRATLARELRTRLGHARDAEEAQETLSSFKESHSFRCAACQLRGSLSLMNVSDYLTFLAEVVLESALDLAWKMTAAQQGEPQGGQRPFIIVGYGKLGGLELGPDSDLDLVFVHGLDAAQSGFLHRLVRRLMTLLTAHTHSGAMYEIDMRLRPEGRSGLMISSLASFEQYQLQDAWVWEQQALVRARPVAGDAELAERFVGLRRSLLCQPRERAELRVAIADMRRRIAQAGADDADLKRGVGGIVDIEFMVQYLVLAYASEHAELCEFTDNVRILEAAARVGVLSDTQSGLLTEAYLALRAERHRTALDIVDDERAREVLDRHRDGVRGIWNQLFGSE
jgi:glutamate-ammonia-ligase adenylyltransferase